MLKNRQYADEDIEPRFGFRKAAFGLCGAMLGSVILGLSLNGTNVKADAVNPNQVGNSQTINAVESVSSNFQSASTQQPKVVKQLRDNQTGNNYLTQNSKNAQSQNIVQNNTRSNDNTANSTSNVNDLSSNKQVSGLISSNKAQIQNSKSTPKISVNNNQSYKQNSLETTRVSQIQSVKASIYADSKVQVPTYHYTYSDASLSSSTLSFHIHADNSADLPQ